MQKSRLRSTILYIYLAVLGTIIVYVIGFSRRPAINDGFDNGECSLLTDSWTVTCNNVQHKNVSLPVSDPIGSYPYPVTFERTLPQYISNTWCIAVPSSLQTVKIVIDGITVKNYNGALGMFQTGIPTNAWLFIKLRGSYAGKELKIITNSKLKDYHGCMHMVLMGNDVDIVYYLNSKSWPTVVTGLILAVSGMIMWVLNSAAMRRGDGDHGDTYMCEYLFAIGVWFIASSGMTQAVTGDVTLSRAIEFYSLMFLAIPIIKHIEVISDYLYSDVAVVISVISLCTTAVTTYCVFVCGIDFMYLNWLTLSVLAVTIVFGVCCFIGMRRRNPENFSHYLLYIRGNVYFGIGAVAEIISMFINPYNQSGLFISAGAVAYVAMVFRWRIERNERENEEKERAIRQTYAKGTFLANMSHEIRTPVNAIISIDKMLIRDSHETNIKSYADDIAASSDELLKLINKVLDSARIEYGKMKIFNVAYRTADLIISLRRIAGEKNKKGVYVCLKYDRSMPSRIQGDKLRICQVTEYLVENAVRHTDDGVVVVGISVSRDNESSGMLKIDVADTGCGIDKNEMENIFKSFRKDSRESGGMGLGLSLSKLLTEMMNGTISAESSKGIGSLFKIAIPQAIIDPEETGEVEECTEPGCQCDMGCLAGLNVLVVDDSAINLKIMKTMLDEMKAAADTSSKGSDALVALNEKKYDVVFMDHIMPGMNGEEVFESLRRSDSINRNTPVIMMTAEDDRACRLKMENIGFAGVMIKPVVMENMAEMVKSLDIGGISDAEN